MSTLSCFRSGSFSWYFCRWLCDARWCWSWSWCLFPLESSWEERYETWKRSCLFSPPFFLESFDQSTPAESNVQSVRRYFLPFQPPVDSFLLCLPFCAAEHHEWSQDQISPPPLSFSLLLLLHSHSDIPKHYDIRSERTLNVRSDIWYGRIVIETGGSKTKSLETNISSCCLFPFSSLFLLVSWKQHLTLTHSPLGLNNG